VPRVRDQRKRWYRSPVKSVAWRVNRERVILLGGGRALLMQIAHPLVAAGVAEHSRFKDDPFGRLSRTLEAMFAIAFGPRLEAAGAYDRINRVHAHVKGKLTRACGIYPAGTPYDARDPQLLLWVYATLVDTALLVYQRYVQELTPTEREQYYQESVRSAAPFGIPKSMFPADLKSFERYVDHMIHRGPIKVGALARKLAQSVLHPKVPFPYRGALEMLNIVTVGLLPEKLRKEFGFTWGLGRQLLLDASTRLIRAALPLLPDFLRVVPPARRAEEMYLHKASTSKC